MTGPWLQTHSGLAFDYLNPKPEQVSIRDIARALSRIPRFLGHTTGQPYSVAQHSVHCCDWVLTANRHALLKRVDKRAIRLAALVHDAHETYVGDMPAPLKWLVPEFGAVEKRAETAVLAALGATRAMFHYRAEVKRVDLAMLATEKRDLMVEAPYPWIELPAPLDLQVKPWGAEWAEGAFLDRYHQLREATRG